MTVEELQKRLEAVDNAISAALRTGQTVQTPNAMVKRYSLTELRAERAALQAELETQMSKSNNGGAFGTPLAYFGRR